MAIKIYVGTEKKTEIARKVLEYSIQTRTNEEVQFTPMIGPEWEYPTEGIVVGTGFSLRRWRIAEACNWEGCAIYMDADQLVFADVSELIRLGKAAMESSGSCIACTYQPDKFNPRPWPQSSVMVIDCAKAKAEWSFHLDQVIAWLKTNTTKRDYADLMHCKFLSKQPGMLPIGWNHLNVYNNETRLLHYTKENEQPWYVPKHPLAHLWKAELRKVLDAGVITSDEVRAAVANFGIKEDWRVSNGLHPEYLKMLDSEPRAIPSIPPVVSKWGVSKILWLTSFSGKIYGESGRPFLNSFAALGVPGDLIATYENMSEADLLDLRSITARFPNVRIRDLTGIPFHQDFKQANTDIIPKEFGGSNSGVCTCTIPPLTKQSKKHKPGCVGAWFCYNAARWASKPATFSIIPPGMYDAVIWVDADCTFTQPFTAEAVASWFGNADLFYFKHLREVVESGLFGIKLNEEGNKKLTGFLHRYSTGAFRSGPRWDDSYQLQQIINQSKPSTVLDLALKVSGNSDVIPGSVVGQFINHDKGRHGRKLGLFV